VANWNDKFNVMGRISYPSVFKKDMWKGKEKTKYECSLVVEKDSKSGKKLHEMLELAKKSNPEIASESGRIWGVRDGDSEKGGEHKGCWIVKAKSSVIVKVKDGKDNSDIREDDPQFYGGATYIMRMSFTRFDMETSDRQGAYTEHQLNAKYYGLVFMKATDPFTSALATDDELADAVSEFEDLEDLLS